MKKIITIVFCLIGLYSFSHTINYQNQILRHWYIEKENRFIEGSFSMYKNGIVYIEDNQNNLISVDFPSLSKPDKIFALQKEAKVEAINIEPKRSNNENVFMTKAAIISLLMILLALILFKIKKREKVKYLIPIVCVGVLTMLYSFEKKTLTTTDPAFVNAAFSPFVPNVATSWDNTYFYVDSKGIPNHEMMVGISNHGWQQQVPIPQCYIGNNHWSIPLNPVLASTPIAIDNVHFTRGAIAIAANGVPIFNYHTNTGVDSYLDGQLDNYGGHCGRGDDYHYHIAPLHLYTSGQTTTNLPCAFSLDGYAVYGTLEPDGSAMNPLDANHGHYGNDGVYHYHGTATAPYMIANFVGQVTEDATYQLIPQAAAHPVRTENWTPLSGALITSCVANGTNTGYNLSYNLNGVPGYATNFSWSGTNYTFNYITPTSTSTTNYNGFIQCSVPLANPIFTKDNAIEVYPNPTKDFFQIHLGKNIFENSIRSISIHNMEGDLVTKISGYKQFIDIKNLTSGTYLIIINFDSNQITKKLVVK